METTRQRLRPVRRSRLNDNEMSFVKRTIKQSIVCAIIIAISFGITLINTTATKNIIYSARNTLYYTVDFKATAEQMINIAKTLPLPWNTAAKENIEDVQTN